MPEETAKPCRIEVFKTGTHTAMNGTTKQYTVDDLQFIAKTYNDQTDYKAPLVLGHPKLDDPAFGWTDKLVVVGQKLFAEVSQVTDNLKAAVKAGMFRTVSIALFADGLLRHIGLLGATPPAVKGLAPVQFATDKEYAEYAWATDEWRKPTVGSLFRGLRDFVIANFSLEKADSVLPSDQIDRLMDSASGTYIPEPPASTGNFAHPNTNKEDSIAMDEKEKKEFKELQDKYAQLELQFGQVTTQVTGLTTELTSTRTAMAEQAKASELRIAGAEFGSFVDGLIRDGKVLPAEKDALCVEFQDTYKANSALQFAQGEKSLIDKFKERLSARIPQYRVPGQQFATGDRAAGTPAVDLSKVGSQFAEVAAQIQPASLDLDAQIQAYADKNGVSYIVAAEHFGAASAE